MLESETSRLQNLIHRYINQPSPELFAEILLLREAVLGTLTTRASTDPMLSGSVEKLERVTDRFLNGFGELRAVQATISKTYEEQVLAPAKDMAGLYSIIEGATGHRDALIWPSLGKSREAFTAMLVAANAYYLSLATASAEDARRNTETIEKTIPVMIDLADNDLQRMALARLKARTSGAARGTWRNSPSSSPAAPNCCATPSTPARPTPSARSTISRSRCASASRRRRRPSTRRCPTSRAGCCRSR